MPKTLEEEFDGAFADLMKEANKDASPAALAAAKTEADVAAAAAATKTPEQLAAEAQAAADAAAAAAVSKEPTAEEKAAAEAEAAKANLNADGTPMTEEQIAERAAADTQRAEAEKTAQATAAAEAARAADDERLARFAEKIAEKTKPAPITPRTEAHAPPPFSADEVKVLGAYEKDWPDVFKAQTIIAREQTRQIVGYMMGEFAKVLAPMQDRLDALASYATEADLKAAVPDYDTVYDAVTQWVDKQPAYLQVGMKHVISQGSADEVTDLIGRWRKETGNTASQTTIQTAPVKKDTELSTAAKKAAAALAPVGSKRTTIVSNGGAEDFDTAFKEAAAVKD